MILDKNGNYYDMMETTGLNDISYIRASEAFGDVDVKIFPSIDTALSIVEDAKPKLNEATAFQAGYLQAQSDIRKAFIDLQQKCKDIYA